MVMSLESEVGKGADNSTNNNALQSGILQDHYDMPYVSAISPEEQDKIRLRVETWLLKNNILGSDRINEIHAKHLRPDEWDMIKDTPERYWPNLFASRMNCDERNKVDQGGFIRETYSADDSKKRYFVSSRVWTGVAEYLYFQSHGALPSPEEEQRIIKECTGPYHRCFFVLAEPAANLKVMYEWADNFCKKWENFKQDYNRAHPARKQEAAA